MKENKDITFRLYERLTNIQISPMVYNGSTTLNKRIQHKLFKSIETRILGYTILGIYNSELGQLAIKYSLCNVKDRFVKKVGYEEALKNNSYVVLPVKHDATIKDIRKQFIHAAESLIKVLEKKSKLRI